MGRIAGIDFGQKRIGVAISDERQYLASPSFTFEAKKDLGQTAKELALELKRFSLEAIVIGLPLFLNGKESPLSTQVREFAKLLEAHFDGKIIFWDERLTSSQVEKTMIEADFSRKKRAQHSDQMAAALILQNYLDSCVQLPL